MYSLGSFAFSSFFADFSAVATTDRRAGLAPRARGCERRGRGEVSGVPEARRIRSVRKNEKVDITRRERRAPWWRRTDAR